MSDFNLVYELDGTIYINLTNKCTNNCVFCIRSIKDDVMGADLFLKSEDISLNDVIQQLDNFKNKISNEIVFCGYGEPLTKIELLKEVAKYIKRTYPQVKIRINTNGQANLIHKRNVLPELKDLIDKFSVSLNGETEEIYNKLSKPNLKNAYSSVKEFITECVKFNIPVTATIVTGYKDYKIDINKCKNIAISLGADFRERKWLNNGY